MRLSRTMLAIGLALGLLMGTVIATQVGIDVRAQGDGTAPLWSQAYYIQAAYRFSFDARKWKGYYRFEHIGIPAGDVAFATIPVVDGSTLGLRYEASTFAALKFEYRTWLREAGSARDHGGYFQVAFTF